MNKSQKAAIHELLEIALTTPRETADIFYDWSPHCTSFQVRVFLGGWTEGADPDHRLSGYLKSSMESEIESLPKKLRSYLDSNNVAELKEERKQVRIAKLQRQLEAAQQ
jgi:hypothetical protein